MSILVKMSDEAYHNYLEVAVLDYANDNVESGRWPSECALARSQADFDKLLPQGLETPDNFLFEIKNEEAGPVVGIIWFAIVESDGQCIGYVYDVEIKPQYRRQGQANAAFKALELFARKLGLSSIGLKVFAHNLEAQALYRKLGYGVTGINMLKHLGADDV